MSGFLLDTDVASEMTFDAPSPRGIAFLAGQDDLWLPAVVVRELAYGLRLLHRVAVAIGWRPLIRA